MNPTIDEDLERMLMKCVERDKADRFPSVVAFKDALSRCERQDY